MHTEVVLGTGSVNARNFIRGELESGIEGLDIVHHALLFGRGRDDNVILRKSTGQPFS